ncbi:MULTISPECIES: type IV pilin protein [Roseateles]|uniref:Prepilin-type N-terminal cleavage/methylation domain-containing protein n=1 Tax=Pelomonas caseinilytica TaxID=2906763 RepID=A0ABS8XRE8_9BURK|nr:MULTISPECIES: type IV pilin protein [unclassified Roseateles]MCE4539790.1 prepilin-type N-terminal cleavage/methylation domain-containing protein [Pelomonas sp. P7]HEV6967082.1 type IV pilin protein [Roseateles sp.]
MSIAPVRRIRGFTLIELMVAVVVAGILAAVAYPVYTSALQRSRRADAMAVLTAIVQAQERYRSNHSSYAEQVGDDGLGIDVSKIAKYYTVSLAGAGSTPSFVTGYVVTASAIASGPQSRDTQCAKLRIQLLGARFSYLSADANDTDTTETASPRCWAR